MRALRFALAGAAAAAVHISAFWLLQRLAGLGNSGAWILAFAFAASAAWALNRRFAFKDRAGERRGTEWLRYLGIAALGAAAHFAAFHAAISALEIFARWPALAIVPGSLASFVVTYAGASSLVFRKARNRP